MALSSISGCLSSADKARERGDLPAAASLYARVIRSDTRSYQGWVGLAASLSAMGQASGARSAALRAAGIAPSIPHAWQILAELLLKGGDAAGARKLIAKAAESNPDSHIPDYVEALILRSEGDGAGAAGRLRSALRKEPGFAQAYMELLELAAASGAFGRLPGIAAAALKNCAASGHEAVLSKLGTLLFAGFPSARRLDAAARLYNALGGLLREKGIALPAGFPREMAAYQLKGGRLPEAEAGLAGFLGTLRGDRRSSVEVFRADCCLGRYRQAFEEGERLLRDKAIGLTDLFCPWFSNRVAPLSFWRKHLALLSGATLPPDSGSGKKPTWPF